MFSKLKCERFDEFQIKTGQSWSESGSNNFLLHLILVPMSLFLEFVNWVVNIVKNILEPRSCF